MIELMKTKSTFAQSEIQDGDVICFQVDLPEKELVQVIIHSCTHLTFLLRIRDFESQGLYFNPVQFYDFLQNRVMIIFRPKHEEIDAEHPEFRLTLSKKQNYDAVCVP